MVRPKVGKAFPGIGQKWADSVRFRGWRGRKSGRHTPESDKNGPTPSDSEDGAAESRGGMLSSESDRNGPIPSDFEDGAAESREGFPWNRTRTGRLRPILRMVRPKAGKAFPGIGQKWADYVRFRGWWAESREDMLSSESDKNGPIPSDSEDESGQEPGRHTPRIGQEWADYVRF